MHDAGMQSAHHPFDAIAVDGDGRSVPQVEPWTAEDHRRRWQELNELVVPSISPR